MIDVIIAGSRDFHDPKLVVATMKKLYRDVDIRIVSGGCRGADKLGEWYGRKYTDHIPEVFPADWRPGGKLDKSAGHRRNERMGNYAEEAVVFWDSISPGSKDMIHIMQTLGKPVHVIEYETADKILKRILQ
jgi:hypothetical protein